MERYDSTKKRMLWPWEEVRGNLTKLEVNNRTAILTFDRQEIILIPDVEKNIFEELKSVMGKEIGILRTDIEGKKYILRDMGDGNE